MKMKLTDITMGGRPKVKLVALADYRSSEDPVALLYRKIRDAALYTDEVPCGLRVAALEMIKAELITIMQSQIDAAEVE